MGCLQTIGDPRGVLEGPQDDGAPVRGLESIGQPAQAGTVPGEQDGASAGMAVECIGQVHGAPDTYYRYYRSGAGAPGFEKVQMFLKRVAYSILLAPKYSLQYWAVVSGGYSLQEKTSMNALSVSSAKWPAMQEVSISWMSE